ncbi:hypothetical protein RRG08_024912 [Elysia crispata]|uniref:Uncharacterized protein n=1 Tax=Elysia crispata TaxID=231223 RepID=A0AAE0ZZK4_9GAST|nr:hypothetical protein RRG08_024912 [Elysia crispata]
MSRSKGNLFLNAIVLYLDLHSLISWFALPSSAVSGSHFGQPGGGEAPRRGGGWDRREKHRKRNSSP